MFVKQMELVNKVFSGAARKGDNRGVDTKFRFRQCFKQVIESTPWFTAPTQDAVKVEGHEIDNQSRVKHHIGQTGTLNMYIRPLEDGLSGIATTPTFLPGKHQIKKMPFAPYSVGNDGLIVDGAQLPGATKEGKALKEGYATAPHEFGHWLGAWHTQVATTSFITSGKLFKLHCQASLSRSACTELSAGRSICIC